MTEPHSRLEAKCKYEDATEIRSLVQSIAKKARAVIVSETEHIDHRQRFVIFGRILLLMFTSHFHMTIGAADARLYQGELEMQKKEPS